MGEGRWKFLKKEPFEAVQKKKVRNASKLDWDTANHGQ